VNRSFMSTAWSKRILQLLILAAIVGLWQLLVSAGEFNAIAVASPGSVANELGSLLGNTTIWLDMLHTLRGLAIGYLAGVAVGTAIGTLMGVSAVVRAYLTPFVAFLNAVPRLALIPLLVAWLGFGQSQQVVLVFLVVVFMVLLTVQASVQNIPKRFVDNARMIGASRLELVREVYLPAIGIWVISSARVAIGIGLQVALVGEFFGGHQGLGYMIEEGEATYNTNLIYAAVVVTAVLAIVIDQLLGVVNRRAARWLP
jgi:ABC-type nitrate/sulfonate/bicarbonate transport system permease component